MPSPKRNVPAGEAAVQDFEQLQQRYEQLKTERIQAETRLEAAKKQLAELQKQARKDWGTDDLEDLRKKLTTLQAENERKRREYQESLDVIEAGLKKIEDGLNT
jgi:predicted  nucleic acid-binding Zn-ribbon protein